MERIILFILDLFAVRFVSERINQIRQNPPNTIFCDGSFTLWKTKESQPC